MFEVWTWSWVSDMIVSLYLYQIYLNIKLPDTEKKAVTCEKADYERRTVF